MCWSRDSPSAHGVDLGGAAVPLQPIEVCRGAEIYLPLEDLIPAHVDTQRSCDPVQACVGAGFLAGLVTPRGIHNGSVC